MLIDRRTFLNSGAALGAVAIGGPSISASGFSSCWLASASVEDFQLLVGGRFSIQSADDPVSPRRAVRLVEAKKIETPRQANRQRRPFALLFQADNGARLEQAAYYVQHDQLGVFQLLLVPMRSTSRGVELEAVFG